MASYLHALASRVLRQAHVALPRTGAIFEPVPGQAEGAEPIDLQAGLGHEAPLAGRHAEGDARTAGDVPVEVPSEPRSRRAAPSDDGNPPPRAPAGRLRDGDAAARPPSGRAPHLTGAAPLDRPRARSPRVASIAERESPSPGEAPSVTHMPPPSSAARLDVRPVTVEGASWIGASVPRHAVPELQATDAHVGLGASVHVDTAQANVLLADVVERRSEAPPPYPIRYARPAPMDAAPAAAALSAARAPTSVASLAAPRPPAQPDRTATAPRRDRHAQVAPVAPVIQVTIGRIEIRNEAAAAPAVRERPAAAPRSSLQHYLQSRGNGRAS